MLLLRLLLLVILLLLMLLLRPVLPPLLLLDAGLILKGGGFLSLAAMWLDWEAVRRRVGRGVDAQAISGLRVHASRRDGLTEVARTRVGGHHGFCHNTVSVSDTTDTRATSHTCHVIV